MANAVVSARHGASQNCSIQFFSHFFTSNFTDTSVTDDDMFPERLNAASSCCSEERDGQVFFARSDGSNGQYWRLSQPPVQAPAPDVASAVSSNFDFL